MLCDSWVMIWRATTVYGQYTGNEAREDASAWLIFRGMHTGVWQPHARLYLGEL